MVRLGLSKAPAADVCPPPSHDIHRPARFEMPAGAVDAHCHVIGAEPEYPLVGFRSYTPPPASPASYLAMLDGTGFTYGVLIQVSVHGKDNRLMLETLRSHRERLRGVAVAALDLPARIYDDMKRDGVVGLRLNELFGGGIGYDELERYDALAQDMGWHLQLLISGERLSGLGKRLARLRSPVVIDHMGHLPTSVGVASAAFQDVVSFVADGGWVKLSGGFRNSTAGAPFKDTIPFARALIEVAPDRCVWGSDWPHVDYRRPMPAVADLVDLLADYAPSPELRHMILVDNPARLYGFK